MISPSSSSTLRAARKLVAEPLTCLERHRTSAGSLNLQRRQSYHTERSTSEQQGRRPPQPVPQLGLATYQRPLSKSRVGTKSPDGNSERTKMLRPYILSQRLSHLVLQGKLDEAVTLLQNSPLDASNVKTWNTLLLHCMKNRRFKLGYKMFTDMKRRGFTPNVRTYSLLLSGLSRIEGWEGHTAQFRNAQALWQGFLRHIEHLKEIHPEHKEIEPSPAAFYVTILGANKEHNAIFGVLNDLDQEGPFSPTEFIYSKVFQAIAYRSQLAPGDEEDVAHRNASDVKLLWKDLAKRAEKNPELVSTFTILYFLKALMKGRPADQLYAFDFVRDYFGLSKPGEEAPQRRIELVPQTLDAVLLLCLATQKYRLCIHYVQQVIDEAAANNRESVIDCRHMDKVLQSYAAMTIAGSVGESERAVETIEWMHQCHALGWKVKPRASTYGWGLMTCWRGGDWVSAARITELMTGCHAEDFVDNSPNLLSPRLANRSQDRRIVPNVRDISCLLRAAFASGEVANMRQCLRMTAFFGGLRSSNDTKSVYAYLERSRHLPDTSVEGREESFYCMKVASALAEVLGRVLEGADPVVDTPEMNAWRALRTRAKKILRGSVKPRVDAPDSELQPLGSAQGLEATERFVDYDLATRAQKSSRTTR